MSLVTDLLPVIDELLGLVDDFGICPYEAFVRTVRHTGQYIGHGEPVTEDVPITVKGGKRVVVTQLADKDVVAGGVESRMRFEIGPIPPAYEQQTPAGTVAGGVPTSTLDPPKEAGVETFYVIKGPGLPPSGMLCKKVSEKFDSPLELRVIVESLGKAA